MEVNGSLKNLINYYHEDKLSHAYLIETNDIDKCLTELKYVLKNINCPHEYKDNCSNCNLCNLLDNNYLPSFIVIEPDGINIKKEQILDLKSRFSTMPLYTKENIYIIKEAEKLNQSSANTMLKFLEEPEDNILGFFLCYNANNVISTIASRCEIIKVYYKNNEDTIYNNEYFSNVYNYLRKIELEKKYGIMYNKSMLLNLYSEKEDYVNIFKLLLRIYYLALKNKESLTDMEFKNKFSFLLEKSTEELTRKLKIISAYLDDLNYNVNIELFLDKFVIELSEMNE